MELPREHLPEDSRVKLDYTGGEFRFEREG